MADPATADWLDGPGFVRWLLAEGLYADRSAINASGRGSVGNGAITAAQLRNISRWRRGEAASVYSADELLTGMGRHLNELPDGLFRDDPRAIPGARDKALALYRDGMGETQIARMVGVTPSTIGDWRRRAGIPAQHPELATR